MPRNGARAYSSPLRAEQAAATRDRIVDAAVALLQEVDGAAVSMQDVADEAGVSVRTVYRAFPTKDDLITGVSTAIEERLLASAGRVPRSPDEAVDTMGAVVRAVFELEPLYRALFATAAGREVHRRASGGRLAEVAQVVADDLDGLAPHEARRAVAALYLLSSSRSVFFLKDYAGLDAEDVSGALEWAVTALVAGIRDPEVRAVLQRQKETGG